MKINVNNYESSIMNASLSVGSNEDAQVYMMRNETGEGVVTNHEILEHVNLLFSDFHMESIISEELRDVDCLAIDYCYEGRLETTLQDGSIIYLKHGDISIDSRTREYKGFYFPLGHYHSISVVFFLPKAQLSLKTECPHFPVDLQQLRDKLLDNANPCLLQNQQEITGIFEALRNVTNKHKKSYILTKIIELLLLLDTLDSADIKNSHNHLYFQKTDVEKIKLMHKMMVDNLEHHYTLNNLSKEFELTLTTMTSCFKGVYGKPINHYMREYRMNYAAKLLITTDRLISEIALSVGYSNPSKFSAAFKQVIGVRPTDYRKSSENRKRKGNKHGTLE